MFSKVSSILGVLLLAFFSGCGQQDSHQKNKTMEYKKLTAEEERVILHKGTEMPYSGKYEKFWEKGTYVCKQCRAALYRSDNKFDAGCGWPSFDDEIPGAVKRTTDADGRRTEITCANCGGHLGHVFLGEGLTPKNTRHCVNSVSLEFVPAGAMPKTDTAIFAGGCFWGVEYYLQKSKGVISVESGYIGGHKDNPTYQEVCAKTTGHLEAVEVVFDPSETNFETIARLFFEIHDPTQTDGQGPDLGEQYLSAVFYRNEEQKEISEKLITILKAKGYKVATLLKPATKFWKAEAYHQDYYEHKGTTPYCHGYTKRF
jgi:peptide methionine sulfoxide reductase msrA/msrB